VDPGSTQAEFDSEFPPAFAVLDVANNTPLLVLAQSANLDFGPIGHAAVFWH